MERRNGVFTRPRIAVAVPRVQRGTFREFPPAHGGPPSLAAVRPMFRAGFNWHEPRPDNSSSWSTPPADGVFAGKPRPW